jgi:hypothetical protein
MGNWDRFAPKAEVLAVLRRAGVPEETLEAVDAELDDPVDLDDAANRLGLRYGISLNSLISSMGGSP